MLQDEAGKRMDLQSSHSACQVPDYTGLGFPPKLLSQLALDITTPNYAISGLNCSSISVVFAYVFKGIFLLEVASLI